MNFDFMGAKLKHTKWKLRLRDFLDGKPGLTAAEATSHRDCELGRWLYADGLTKYGAVPGMRQLVSEHEKLHQTVKRIVELKDAGRTVEAEAEFGRIDGISKQLMELLTSVEAEVKKT